MLIAGAGLLVVVLGLFIASRAMRDSLPGKAARLAKRMRRRS